MQMDMISELETARTELEKVKGENANANASLTDAKTEVETLKGQLTAANSATSAAKQEAIDALAKASTAEAAKVAAETQLTDEKAKVAKLEGEAKTVAQKVIEITGRDGNEPVEGIARAQEKPVIKSKGVAGAVEAMQAKGWSISDKLK